MQPGEIVSEAMRRKNVQPEVLAVVMKSSFSTARNMLTGAAPVSFIFWYRAAEFLGLDVRKLVPDCGPLPLATIEVKRARSA